MSMRHWVGLLCLVICTVGASSGWAKVSKGDRVRSHSAIRDRHNKPLDLRAYGGRVVVLTFGASWCKPCKQELPAYDKLAAKFKKRAGDKVAFVAINIDSKRENANRFLEETGVKNIRVGFDPQNHLVDQYAPGTMPTTYVIDTRGVVRTVHSGYRQGDEKTIEQAVVKLLAAGAGR
jgi:thiol-disulfide isomerase/thioredoxin